MEKAKSWEVSDGFWARAKPLIPQRKRPSNQKRKTGVGRKTLEPRKVFKAIVYVLRTGIQ